MTTERVDDKDTAGYCWQAGEAMDIDYTISDNLVERTGKVKEHGDPYRQRGGAFDRQLQGHGEGHRAWNMDSKAPGLSH